MMIRHLNHLALLLAVAPAAAEARKKDAPPPSEDQPAASAQVAASLEFFAGFANHVENDGIEGDADVTLGIVPGFDKMLGKNFGVGGEFMFVWGKGEDQGERRLILDPHLRFRMSFPVLDKVGFDALLALGPTIWTGEAGVPDAEGGATRFGWSVRFNFGGSYQFHEQAAAFANLGYYTSTSYGDDLKLNLNCIPFGVGLRSAF